MKKKIALIVGITGQDGSYLAEFLLKKKYVVHGIKRRSSSLNTQRIDHLYEDPHNIHSNFHLHYADLNDYGSIIDVIRKLRPDELYNLGAQSHVAVSFTNPILTSDINALGTLRILEAIRTLGLSDHTKFYQASTSELYGLIQDSIQNELTPFYPRSPYAVAKLYAYWITINYREAYGLFACNGILFNHESPRRGETFVTRKITRGISDILYGLSPSIYLGNLNSKRDWGHAKDYVEMQWMMLQQKQPKDYVIASGIQYSVRDFIKQCFKYLNIEINFSGEGLDEVCIVTKNDSKYKKLKVGSTIIKVDPIYFRPTEVVSLIGDASLAHNELGWKTKISFESLVKEMMDYDLDQSNKKLILSEHGFN